MTISYGIFLFSGNTATSKITVGTTGQIDGVAGIRADSPLSVTNHGVIRGSEFALALSPLNDTVVNSGKIVGGVVTDNGIDTVINFEKVGHTIKSGTIVGLIDLGDDNDTFKGGNKAETVRDGNGEDHYSLGGGNDTYLATHIFGDGGPDDVNGGKGVDTYSMNNSSADLKINLDDVVHYAINPHEAHPGGTIDFVTNFENVLGGFGADTIVGSNGANALNGGEGSDALTGLRGGDVMTGGDGADEFLFLARADSGVTAKTCDVITDFTQGADKISLFENLSVHLSFIGQEKFHHLHDGDGEFRYSFTHGDTLISIDINDDGKVDSTILLKGLHALTNADFEF